MNIDQERFAKYKSVDTALFVEQFLAGKLKNRTYHALLAHLRFNEMSIKDLIYHGKKGKGGYFHSGAVRNFGVVAIDDLQNALQDLEPIGYTYLDKLMIDDPCDIALWKVWYGHLGAVSLFSDDYTVHVVAKDIMKAVDIAMAWITEDDETAIVTKVEYVTSVVLAERRMAGEDLVLYSK